MKYIHENNTTGRLKCKTKTAYKIALWIVIHEMAFFGKESQSLDLVL